MKRLFFVILNLILILTLSLSLCSCGKKNASLCNASSDTKLTFLICGLDDVAENTDVMILCNYDSVGGVVSFLQIPRDTFCNIDSYSGKINGLYSNLKSGTNSAKTAMSNLTKSISETFGVSIDGYLAISTHGLRLIIDKLGGIDITLPANFINSFNKLELKEGSNHLSGKDSVELIRYREGYLTGDLGRLNMQKLVLSALVNKMCSSDNLKQKIDVIFSLNKGIVTDIDFVQIGKFILKNQGRIRKINLLFATLPGESAEDESGVWNFYANKSGADKILSQLGFNRIDSFDKNDSLKNKNFRKIYDRTDIDPVVYDEKGLQSIEIR